MFKMFMRKGDLQFFRGTSSGVLLFFGVFYVTQIVSAVTQGTCPNTTDYTKVNGVCVPTSAATGGLSEKDVPTVLTGFAATLLEVFGILAAIAFIVSGFQYLMASGDEKEAEIAKKNLKYSVIAVVVALSGVIIINAIEAILLVKPNGIF